MRSTRVNLVPEFTSKKSHDTPVQAQAMILKVSIECKDTKYISVAQ